MADRDAELSQGSDIEVDYKKENERIDLDDGNVDRIDREVNFGDDDDWLINLIEEDSDFTEFLRFQNKWMTEDFHPRTQKHYSRTCFKRPLVGESKTGHIRQVATYSRFQHEN